MNFLKKWRWWLAVLAGALVLLLMFVTRLGRQPEPTYGGRPLSSWFNEAKTQGFIIENSPPAQAVKIIGAPAVPYLAAQLRYGSSSGEEYYRKLYPRLPRWVRGRLTKPDPPGVCEETAAILLGEIGPPAKAAVPDMIVAYNRVYLKVHQMPSGFRINWAGEFSTPSGARKIPTTPVSAPEGHLRLRLVCSLAAVGGEDRETVPLLLAVMREPSPAIQSVIAYQAGNKTNLDAAIKLAEPTLLFALEDPVAEVRATAATMLGALATNHPELIKPLMKAAEDPVLIVRRAGMESLSKTTASFETLLPLLGRLMDDDDPKLRRMVASKLVHAAGGAKFQDTLIEALGNPDPAIRAAAAKTMRTFRFGSRTGAAIRKLTILTDEVNEPDAHVREEAKATLARLESQTGTANR